MSLDSFPEQLALGRAWNRGVHHGENPSATFSGEGTNGFGSCVMEETSEDGFVSCGKFSAGSIPG